MRTTSPRGASVPGASRLPAKLPWLTSNSSSATQSPTASLALRKKIKIPGSFVTDSNSSSNDSPTTAKPATKPATAEKQPLDVPAKNPILEVDPSIRAVASTPSLERSQANPKPRKLSLNYTTFPPSQPAPAPSSLPSVNTAIPQPGIVGKLVSRAEYTPSEYSSTPPNERKYSFPHDIGPKSTIDLTPPLVDTSRLTPRPKAPLRSPSVERAGEMFSVREVAKSELRPSDATVLHNTVQPSRRPTMESLPSPLAPPSPRTAARPSIQSLPEARPRKQSQPVPPSTKRPSVISSEEDQSKSLRRAVTGLEAVMQEALHVAKEAVEANKPEEVAEILTEANLALKNAATVRGYMIDPLRLSESDVGISSDTDTSITDSSSSADECGSIDTAPTFLTKSAYSSRQPILSAPYQRDRKRPKSEEAGADHSDKNDSIAQTPPRLYQPHSADSIVKDFAYSGPSRKSTHHTPRTRASSASDEPTMGLPPTLAKKPGHEKLNFVDREPKSPRDQRRDTIYDSVAGPQGRQLRQLEPVPTDATLAPQQNVSQETYTQRPHRRHRKRQEHSGRHPYAEKVFQSNYYDVPDRNLHEDAGLRGNSRYESLGPMSPVLSLKHPFRRNHISLREGQRWRLERRKRQPIAREWKMGRKRITAAIACLNTALIGLLIGIYAGEVPRIQYQTADQNHRVILGNVVLYLGLAITTLLAWPLPLLHGRKPYTLAALAIAVPLEFPQALATNVFRSPNPSYSGYKVELLLPRALAGLALGFANINNLATLLDLFGASLQSTNPHQEFVARDDVRRQGGGMGLWLGVWAWCWIGSLSVGFAIGAGIVAHLNAEWGFYVVVILLAFFLVINVVAPETRRASYRRSILHYFDEEEKVKRRVARGEVMLHISQDGPKWWWQEARAGVKLMWMMAKQPGFFVLALYLAWIYAQVVLVTLLLGALLSRDYRWHAQYVGLAVLAIALGALLAVPLAYAGLFSRTRKTGPRTDSMTFQTQLTWSSHFVRRCIFTLVLPFAGLAYTLASPGPRVSAAVPILFAAFVGFLSCLAVTECVGLIMETFDTSDLQPGINSRHRLQSLAESTRKRRTNYSSFPRVAAGLFFSQGLGFLLAAAATGVSGTITRALGAQAATGCVAGILLGITIFLTLVLLRWKSVQVIPKGALPRFGSADERMLEIYAEGDEYWKPVVIGTPSGEVRRMNLLELGNMSRWTEIRRLNKLIKE